MYRFSFFLCFLLLACGDDSGTMDAGTSTDAGMSTDASVADAAANDAPDTGVVVEPRALWVKFRDALAFVCPCQMSTSLEICESQPVLSDSVIECISQAVAAPESQPNLQCLDRRLNDLSACADTAMCGSAEMDACLMQFERRLEDCPMLSEDINDALNACPGE